MIRTLQTRDLDWLRQHQNEYEWELGPDFAGALVYADADDMPVMVVGGWRRVEVHAVFDASWNTAGMRLAAFRELHEAMAAEMKAQGFGEAYTWIDDMKAFTRRLSGLGWKQIQRSWWGKAL